LAAGGATVGRVSEADGASGSEKLLEPVFRVPEEGDPNVVPFGPVMRIKVSSEGEGRSRPRRRDVRPDTRQAPTNRSRKVRQLWLMLRKRLGKICRGAAVSARPSGRILKSLFLIHQQKQAATGSERDGTALA
jgi:hypothetical protein